FFDQFIQQGALLIESDRWIAKNFLKVRARLNQLLPGIQLFLHLARFAALYHHIRHGGSIAARDHLYTHRAAPPRSSILRVINRASSSGRISRLIISSARRTLCSAV